MCPSQWLLRPDLDASLSHTQAAPPCLSTRAHAHMRFMGCLLQESFPNLLGTPATWSFTGTCPRLQCCLLTSTRKCTCLRSAGLGCVTC